MYHAALLPELLLDRPVPAGPAARPRLLGRTVAPGVLVGLLVAYFGLDMLLLWRFVDFAPAWAYPLGGAIVAALAFACARAMRGLGEGPTLGALAICFGAAFLLYLVGGEGRLFYSNIDWVTRDGVLHDMGTHPWPFAYLARGLPEILRAPTGMYLVPALGLKLGGPAAGDWTLLVQNSVLLTILFGLSAQLFPAGRRRAIGLAVFVFFSGMDVLGALLIYAPHGAAIPDHLEWWSGLQYSSNITLAFWTPQHAMAGWACAAGFMLWHDRRMPLAVMLALVPLSVLWSPLAAIGAMPFAMLAGLRTLLRRELRPIDILLPAAASLLAVPALLYLDAAMDSVGGRPFTISLPNYILFEMMEVVPFLFVAASARCRQRFGWPALGVIAGSLILIPFWQIGGSADFMMRASIPALAILSVMMGHLLVAEPRPGRRIAIGAILAIGGVTGLHEINRGIMWPPSPTPLCTFFGTWGPSPPGDKSTYLAPIERLPAVIRPHAATLIPNRDPKICWARPWPRPTGV